MASTSDLDTLDHFLKGQTKTYELPQLEIKDDKTDFVTEMWNQLKEWLGKYFDLKPPASGPIDAEFWKKCAAIAVAVLVIGAVSFVIYMYWKSRNRRSSTTTASTLLDSFEGPSTSTLQDLGDLPLDKWLRARWRQFLAAQQLGLCLTPAEHRQKFQRPSRPEVLDLDQAMFSSQFPSRSRTEWEQLFRTWETDA